jgi:hypothetical protein
MDSFLVLHNNNNYRRYNRKKMYLFYISTIKAIHGVLHFNFSILLQAGWLVCVFFCYYYLSSCKMYLFWLDYCKIYIGIKYYILFGVKFFYRILKLYQSSFFLHFHFYSFSSIIFVYSFLFKKKKTFIVKTL